MKPRPKVSTLIKTFRHGKRVIRTNLYDLIRSVSEALPFEDDRLVAMIVNDILMRSGASLKKSSARDLAVS